MSLLEHLEELRRRIIIVAFTILVAAIAGFFVADPIIAILQSPLPEDVEVIQTGIAEAFGVTIQVALMTGLAIAMPVILFQVWAFVTPGLTRSERRLVWPLLIAAIVLFIAGLGIGFLLIPVAVDFLLGFSLPGVEPMLRVADYIGFVTSMLLAFGLALQFPVILYVLARIGILSYAFLSRRRRFVALLIVLFSIVITPGDIVIGSATLAVVMYGLFEATLQLIRILGR